MRGALQVWVAFAIAYLSASGANASLPWQKAVDEACAGGGGEVVVPPGRHLTGSLELKSNVTLTISDGATLVGSDDIADYKSRPGPMGSLSTALIFADGATNVAIRGGGVIDGRGDRFPALNMAGIRPHLVLFKGCQDVVVEGVTMTNSARWTCSLEECRGIVVRGVRIDAHANYNNDGIDIASENVLVENCEIDADDDAICVKSHNPRSVSENIRVRNCTVASNCNFLKLGTRGHGGFRNVEMSDCVLRPCRVDNLRKWSKWLPRIPGVDDKVTGLAGIAIEMVDGGVAEDIVFRRIDMTAGGVQTPIFIRLGRRTAHPHGRVSRLRNVLVEDVRGYSASSLACSVTGVAGLRPENIVFRDIDLKFKGGGLRADALVEVPECEADYPENRMFDFQMLPAYGFYLRHADGVSFERVKTALVDGARDEREPVVSDDCSAVGFVDCEFRPADTPLWGPERAGGVYVEGERVKVWCGKSERWTMEDFLGHPFGEGVADQQGCVALDGLQCGYWVFRSGGRSHPVVVVPDPRSRPDDADGFACVDSALSWISKPQFLACPWYGGDTFRYMADLMRLAGVRRARERLSWNEVQPQGDASPEWSYYGENARRLKDRGIKVCNVFHSAPKWTRPIDRLPGDFAALYRFCESAARDMDAVEAWEFWNEEIAGFSPEPVWDYAAAMKAASLGFHAGRPGVKVLNGSLCLSPNEYDDLMFRNEIGKYVDVVNIHEYPPLKSYPDVFGGRREFFEGVGEGAKAVWTTECGTMALGVPAEPGRNRKERCFSRDQELLLAEFYPKSQMLMMMEGVARGYFFVFGAFAEDGGKKDFSVVRRNGFPAPAFASISTLNAKLAGKRLVGEMSAPEGVRMFLLRGNSGEETVVFWSVSPLDSASRENPVSNLDGMYEREVSIPASAGEYTLTGICGTPEVVSSESGRLTVKSSRFPKYIDGLRGLSVSKSAIRPGEPSRYRPKSNEDMSVVVRAVPDKRDFKIGGVKCLARLMKRSGRVSFEVWNLSSVRKTGRLESCADGRVEFGSGKFDLPPMGCAKIDAVYHPDGMRRQRLGVRWVADGRMSTRVLVDVEPMGEFFAECVKIPLAVDDPANWLRNDSADHFSCEKDLGDVKFTVSWDRDADKWFYPKYIFAPGETARGASFLVFEAKSSQPGGNSYSTQNYWLDTVEGREFRHDMPPTGEEWTRYCIDLGPVRSPRADRVVFDASKLNGFRLGGNPVERQLTFWIRKAMILKKSEIEEGEE